MRRKNIEQKITIRSRSPPKKTLNMQINLNTNSFSVPKISQAAYIKGAVNLTEPSAAYATPNPLKDATPQNMSVRNSAYFQNSASFYQNANNNLYNSFSEKSIVAKSEIETPYRNMATTIMKSPIP